jgi:hypothetical protein
VRVLISFLASSLIEVASRGLDFPPKDTFVAAVIISQALQSAFKPRQPYMPEMDPQSVTVPILKDLTIDNITDNVKLINSQCENPRLKYILERTVQHLHDLARETRLSQQEWMQAIQFLTSVGQICTDVRQVRLFPLELYVAG